MCSLHCSSRQFSGGSYLGFLFCFCCFFCVVFRKQVCFGSEGVARDKLVFEMLKHDHVSFQTLGCKSQKGTMVKLEIFVIGLVRVLNFDVLSGKVFY